MAKYSIEDIKQLCKECNLDISECLIDITKINLKLNSRTVKMSDKEKNDIIDIMHKAEELIRKEGILR